MPTLRVWTRLEWTANGQFREYGNLVVPAELTYSEQLFEGTIAVPSAAVTTLFLAGQVFTVPAVAFLIVPDALMYIGWAASPGGSDPNSSVIRVAAGMPLLLSTGTSKDYNANLATRLSTGGQTGQSIETIQGYQSSGAAVDCYIAAFKL